jgi:hypothetical protein
VPTRRRGHSAEAALAVVLGGLTLLPLGLGGLTPRVEAREAAVLVAPWGGLEAAAAIAVRSGARIARAGGMPGVFVLTSEDAGLPARLHDAGAWIVADPLLAGGCVTKLNRNIQFEHRSET